MTDESAVLVEFLLARIEEDERIAARERQMAFRLKARHLSSMHSSQCVFACRGAQTLLQ